MHYMNLLKLGCLVSEKMSLDIFPEQLPCQPKLKCNFYENFICDWYIIFNKHINISHTLLIGYMFLTIDVIFIQT